MALAEKLKPSKDELFRRVIGKSSREEVGLHPQDAHRKHPDWDVAGHLIKYLEEHRNDVSPEELEELEKKTSAARVSA